MKVGHSAKILPTTMLLDLREGVGSEGKEDGNIEAQLEGSLPAMRSLNVAARSGYSVAYRTSKSFHS